MFSICATSFVCLRCALTIHQRSVAVYKAGLEMCQPTVANRINSSIFPIIHHITDKRKNPPVDFSTGESLYQMKTLEIISLRLCACCIFGILLPQQEIQCAHNLYAVLILRQVAFHRNDHLLVVVGNASQRRKFPFSGFGSVHRLGDLNVLLFIGL